MKKGLVNLKEAHFLITEIRDRLEKLEALFDISDSDRFPLDIVKARHRIFYVLKKSQKSLSVIDIQEEFRKRAGSAPANISQQLTDMEIKGQIKSVVKKSKNSERYVKHYSIA